MFADDSLKKQLFPATIIILNISNVYTFSDQLDIIKSAFLKNVCVSKHLLFKQ